MRPADLTPVARDVMKLPRERRAHVLLVPRRLPALRCCPGRARGCSRAPTSSCIVLIFWTVHEPRSIGQGVAFALGLLMDVSDSMLLGQHALAYVIAVFGAQVLRVRILSFHLPEQTLHVLGLTVAACLVMLVAEPAAGRRLPGLRVPRLARCSRRCCWAPVNWLLYSAGGAPRAARECAS